MCLRVHNRYACGHERVVHYVSCVDGSIITPKQGVRTTPCHFVKCTKQSINIPSLCPGCENHRKSLLAAGWACSKCKQGPNRELVCNQKLINESILGQDIICGHELCLQCTRWGQEAMMRLAEQAEANETATT